MARPLLKLKRSILLVMYSWLNALYYEMMVNTVLLCSSWAVTHDGLRYQGHAHQLYRQEVSYIETEKQ